MKGESLDLLSLLRRRLRSDIIDVCKIGNFRGMDKVVSQCLSSSVGVSKELKDKGCFFKVRGRMFEGELTGKLFKKE